LFYESSLQVLKYSFGNESRISLFENVQKKLKGIVHPKIEILSLFTHPNLFLSSAEHKIRYFEERGNQKVIGLHLFPVWRKKL